MCVRALLVSMPSLSVHIVLPFPVPVFLEGKCILPCGKTRSLLLETLCCQSCACPELLCAEYPPYQAYNLARVKATEQCISPALALAEGGGGSFLGL